MIYVNRIWEFIFSYHSSILLLFLWHSPVECNPFAWACWGFYVQIPPQSEQKFQVSCHQKSVKKKEKKDTKQLEIREKFLMYFCVFFSKRHYSIKDIPLSIFSFLFFFRQFFVSRFLSCFWNLKLRGQSCDIILHYHYSHYFKLCFTVDCVFFDDIDGAVCCSMYVPCLLFGFITWRFSKRNSPWVEKKKIKFYK